MLNGNYVCWGSCFGSETKINFGYMAIMFVWGSCFCSETKIRRFWNKFQHFDWQLNINQSFHFIFFASLSKQWSLLVDSPCFNFFILAVWMLKRNLYSPYSLVMNKLLKATKLKSSQVQPLTWHNVYISY